MSVFRLRQQVEAARRPVQVEEGALPGGRASEGAKEDSQGTRLNLIQVGANRGPQRVDGVRAGLPQRPARPPRAEPRAVLPASLGDVRGRLGVASDRRSQNASTCDGYGNDWGFNTPHRLLRPFPASRCCFLGISCRRGRLALPYSRGGRPGGCLANVASVSPRIYLGLPPTLPSRAP